MESTISIFCKNNQTQQTFPAGVSLMEVYEQMQPSLLYPVACATVNNKIESLTYACYKSKDVKFLDVSDPAGMRIYVKSLCFVMAKAVHDLFPDAKLYIEHGLSRGYYCEVETGQTLTYSIVKQIKRHMQALIAADLPFEEHERPTPEVIALFEHFGMSDKAHLLQTTGEAYSTYYTLDGYPDSFYGGLLPSTSHIYLFDIERYRKGILLRIPNRNIPFRLEPYVNQEKMSAVFREWRQFQKALNLSNVGELNQCIIKDDIATIVQVAEIVQEKQIGKIADEIYQRYESGVRVVLIAGPSSSGKTTFCKRLHLELLANTLRPHSISLDDYYLNRVDTPLDAEGNYDYESLYAIDLQKFNEDLKQILAGAKVDLPSYDFPSGTRVYRGDSIQLGDRSILIMEGIHGLNPSLVPNIPPSSIYKIYVSALTSISLDDHNWIPTTDNRLLRRIVRDHRFRGCVAKETISRWASVRKGEDKWIFPYQENADAMFNSAMLYELAALRDIAEPVLKEVSPMDDEYSEAHRLLQFLQFFKSIDQSVLPSTSLLREFVGGSSFKY